MLPVGLLPERGITLTNHISRFPRTFFLLFQIVSVLELLLLFAYPAGTTLKHCSARLSALNILILVISTHKQDKLHMSNQRTTFCAESWACAKFLHKPPTRNVLSFANRINYVNIYFLSWCKSLVRSREEQPFKH